MIQYSVEVITEPAISVTVESDCDVIIQIQDQPINLTVETIAPIVQVLSEEPQVSVTIDQQTTSVEVQEQQTQIVEVVTQGSQGPPGPQGPVGPAGPSISYITKVTDVIPAGQTKYVDTVAINSFSVLDYTISLKNVSQSVVRGLKMLAANSDEGVVNQVYSKTGDSVSFQLDTEIQLSDVKLRVTNLESFDLDLVFVRTTL